MPMLKIFNYDIVFQEVPEETTLALNVTNCPHRCKGCHSPFLRKDIGEPLEDIIETILKNYKDLITCICFMGGDQHKEDLIKFLKRIKQENLKTCLYSGNNSLEDVKDFLPYLDYIKIGEYKEELGPLNSPTTNQVFLKKEKEEWKNYTYKFQKRGKDL